MSKERLSKLQKWILSECYKNNELRKREIYKRFFGLQLGYYDSGKHVSSELYNSIAVILSRSLKRMKEKGLIMLSYPSWKRSLILTEKGTERAKSLLLSKAINNKREKKARKRYET